MFGHTTTSSYAIQALVCLARSSDSWMQAGDIAESTGIPRYYLVKILHSLRRAGFVATKRGYTGGYRLGQEPEGISLLDVITAVEGKDIFEQCMLGPGRCSPERRCAVHSFWWDERQRIKRAYSQFKLNDLAACELPKTLETRVRAAHAHTEKPVLA